MLPKVIEELILKFVEQSCQACQITYIKEERINGGCACHGCTNLEPYCEACSEERRMVTFEGDMCCACYIVWFKHHYH